MVKQNANVLRVKFTHPHIHLVFFIGSQLFKRTPRLLPRNRYDAADNCSSCLAVAPTDFTSAAAGDRSHPRTL